MNNKFTGVLDFRKMALFGLFVFFLQQVFGLSVMVPCGDSMDIDVMLSERVNLPQGSSNINVSDVEVGGVYGFRDTRDHFSGSLIFHRAVEVDEAGGCVVFKGDNNVVSDGCISVEDIEYRVLEYREW